MNDEVDPELAALLGKHGVTKAAEVKPGETQGATAHVWPIPENRFARIQRQRQGAAERHARSAGRRQFIRPENALTVVRRLPAPGETTHCILRGDFVLADLLPYLLDGYVCDHLRIATLTMSVENAKLLRKLRDSGQVGRLTMVISHYFQQVNKSTIYHDIRGVLDEVATFTVMRSHAKVICIARRRPEEATACDWLTIEGSANLRSSDNLEQMTIFNDEEVHAHHAEWIDYVRDNPPET